MKAERRKALGDALEGAIRDGTSVRLGTEMCRELHAYLAELERKASLIDDPAKFFRDAVDGLRQAAEHAKGKPQ